MRQERRIAARPIEAAVYTDVREAVSRLMGRQIPDELAALFDLGTLGWLRLGVGTEYDDFRPVYLAGIWGIRVVVDFPAPLEERENSDFVDFRLAGVALSRRGKQRLLGLRYAAGSGLLERLGLGLDEGEVPNLLRVLYGQPVEAYHPAGFGHEAEGLHRLRSAEIPGWVTEPEAAAWMIGFANNDWLLEVEGVEEGLRAPRAALYQPLIQLKASRRRPGCWRLDFISSEIQTPSFYLPKRLS